MTLLMGIHGYICLQTTRANLLYIIRYFLVWILIFGTAIIWLLYSGEVLVAPFGSVFQTDENTRLLILAGVVSLCGSLIGWHLAFLRFNHREYTEFSLSDKNRLILKKVGGGLAIVFALLYVWKAGGIISGDSLYSNREEGFELTFGVFNIFHFFGISMLLLASIRGQCIEVGYLLLAISTLTLGMLAGSRADFLPQAFMLVLFAFNLQIASALSKRHFIRLVTWTILLLFLVFIAYILSTFIAGWRTGASSEIILNIIMITLGDSLITEAYGHKMLFFETGNMMLGSLYSAIVQVRTGITGHLLGESYFDYILKSPPAFLNMPRPLGLEWKTDIGNVIMTQGGIFEVAEAFWNFDLAGCFFVSLFISWLFGWLLQRGLKYSNYFYLTWYMIFGLHSFRSIWYQNFSYFRLATVMLVVYIVARALCNWFTVDRYRHLGRR
jgi:hypothetical protein